MKRSSVSTKYITPKRIISLKENEILVFGSNRLGKHIGGTARIAKDKFGAQDGVSEGITGQCYAIPTFDENFNRVGLLDLTISMTLFLQHVRLYKDRYTYYLTKIGCGYGIVGWSVYDIKEVFQICLKRIFNGVVPENLYIPEEFDK